MKTAIKTNRSVVVAGAAATLAIAALGFAGAAQARDNVYWSVGVGSPGVALNVGNALPVYVQPQPVYVQPAPVYYQPAPVYYQPPVYVRPAPVYVVPQPVYYGRPHGWNKHHKGYYAQGPGYAPVYYQRGGRHGHQHGDRDDD
ncbi:MAG: hypothetical protein ACREXG_03820 [Polaromonas sp.]